MNITTADKAALSGSISFSLKDNDSITTATWFVMMWIRCSDGTICAFESTEGGSELNSTGLYYYQPYRAAGNLTKVTYIQTAGHMGITTGMIVASIILGALGPLLWIGYMIADQLYYNKTGKQLSF